MQITSRFTLAIHIFTCIDIFNSKQKSNRHLFLSDGFYAPKIYAQFFNYQKIKADDIKMPLTVILGDLEFTGFVATNGGSVSILFSYYFPYEF